MAKDIKLHQYWILDQLGHIENGVNREYYTGKIKPDMSKIGRVKNWIVFKFRILGFRSGGQ